MEEHDESQRDVLDIGLDFSILTATKASTSVSDIVESLSKDKGFNNINITITINRGLYEKIESIQNDIQSRSKNRVSKSRVVRTICEHFLSFYDLS